MISKKVHHGFFLAIFKILKFMTYHNKECQREAKLKSTLYRSDETSNNFNIIYGNSCVLRLKIKNNIESKAWSKLL